MFVKVALTIVAHMGTATGVRHLEAKVPSRNGFSI